MLAPPLFDDGASVEVGAVLWRVRGKARALLSGERTALNLAQRMSGVATAARRYVEALPPGSKTRIADTRKTTPGLRALDDVHAAVRRVGELPGARPLLEVSGGITLPRIAELAAAGIDVISVGALTHSAPDIAIDLKL